MTKAEKCRQNSLLRWQDPAYRARMMEAQKGIGYRTYPR